MFISYVPDRQQKKKSETESRRYNKTDRMRVDRLKERKIC